MIQKIKYREISKKYKSKPLGYLLKRETELRTKLIPNVLKRLQKAQVYGKGDEDKLENRLRYLQAEHGIVESIAMAKKYEKMNK